LDCCGDDAVDATAAAAVATSSVDFSALLDADVADGACLRLGDMERVDVAGGGRGSAEEAFEDSTVAALLLLSLLLVLLLYALSTYLGTAECDVAGRPESGGEGFSGDGAAAVAVEDAGRRTGLGDAALRLPSAVVDAAFVAVALDLCGLWLLLGLLLLPAVFRAVPLPRRWIGDGGALTIASACAML
jgi:hypothetical protein